MIYLFDDVTERLDLERRYDALIRVQGETLDNLTEAVAVFASDGRLRLYNPVFARMWRLSSTCSPSGRMSKRSATGRGRCTASTRSGRRCARRSRRSTIANQSSGGSTAPTWWSIAPPSRSPTAPPTFQDVTDTVNVERALREGNEALEAADKLKTNFVHHVSYELRSPLTNIIGFAHFLGDPLTGPLTEKQREYLGYITVSTNALLAIINNILDLATIDAGTMTLNLGSVDIRKTMEAAAEGVQDRLVKNGIRLESAPRPTSAPSSPTSGACASRCSICWPMPWAFRPAARSLRRPAPHGCRRVPVTDP